MDTTTPLLLLLVGMATLILRYRYQHRIRKRNNFGVHIQKETIKKQNGKCAMGKHKLNKYTIQFHHKDGNSSNNKAYNCEALCANCHSIKTRRKMKRKHIFGW